MRVQHLPGDGDWARQTMAAADGSFHLDVPVHSPAFLFERTSQAADGRTVEFVRSVYRGDRYRLVAELSQRRGRELQPVSVEFAAGAPGDGA